MRLCTPHILHYTRVLRCPHRFQGGCIAFEIIPTYFTATSNKQLFPHQLTILTSTNQVLLFLVLDHDIRNQGIRLASNHSFASCCTKIKKHGYGFVHINVKAIPHTLTLSSHKAWMLVSCVSDASRGLVSCVSDASRGPVNRLFETSLHGWKAHNRMIKNIFTRDARIVVWD